MESIIIGTRVESTDGDTGVVHSIVESDHPVYGARYAGWLLVGWDSSGECSPIDPSDVEAV